MGKHQEDVKAMMADLRCPVCSAGIEILEVTHENENVYSDRQTPQQRMLYRHVRMVCSKGCEVSTQGYGSEALYKMMTNWVKMKRRLKLKDKK